MTYPKRVPLLLLLASLGAPGLAGCTKAGQPPATGTAPATASSPSGPAESSYAAQRTGPIAPGCSEWSCAEVEMSAALRCDDPRGNEGAQRFGSTTRISGVTDQVGCEVRDAANGNGQDLRLMVRPANAAENDASEINFTLRSYTGPGTYRLFNVEGEGDFMGLEVVGNVDAPPGSRNAEIEVGTADCRPSACEAIVAEGSEPIPNDEYATHPYRVRVEVRCPAGSELGEIVCEDGSPTCAFTSAPTLLGDFLCGN